MRLYCVGLTGGIGAGKSLVSDRFARLGVAVVDTDLIARELTQPGGGAVEPLIACFGPGITTAQGYLDRATMRNLVFSNATAKAQLEAIMHPMIRMEAERRLASSEGSYVLLVVPLLVENLDAYKTLIDQVLLVDCEETLQVQRASARVGMNRQLVAEIMANQASRSERRGWADQVIDNNGGLPELDTQVTRLHAIYLSLAVARR